MSDEEPFAAVRTSRAAIVSGAYHHHLVTDDVRVRAYARAIAERVRPGDVVADLGAGSGLLAMLAARAGARRVYAVEIDRHAHAALARIVAANGLDGVVEPVHADAEEWTPPETVDVALCEMMETGLMNEDQAAVMNHVRSAWPTPPRDVVPESASLRLVLASALEERQGFRVHLPHFERSEPYSFETLSGEVEYAHLDFRLATANRVDATARVVASVAGDANAIVLVTRTALGGGVEAPPSSDHASPLVLPLAAPVSVKAGEAFVARVRYEFGSVTGAVSVELRREG